MILSPGTKLGPYEVLSSIGAGGMGAVWKARDTRLDRTVAIKTIEGKFTERFEREAKTIASLNHPHVCTLFDVGDNYLVMEYIEGAPLKGPLPVVEVARLGAQIADALDAAHRKGITHRDLKPGNVLVTKSGVKVIDFGLAKGGSPVRGEQDVTLTKPLTGEGTILGTVPYMSPEQLQGQEADARSDIFALGCVLYEMLTGRRAFEGKSQVSIMAAILEHEPAPITEHVVPAWLDRIIRRCLRKNPDDRWQSARDVAIELCEPPAVSGTVPRAVMRPWIAACAALALLSTGLGWYAVRRAGFRQQPAGSTINAALSIPLPDGTRLTGAYPNLALSPNGASLAIPLLKGADSLVYLRPLSEHSWRTLPGTNGAHRVFWSPDSTQIGFVAGNKLKRVEPGSGEVRVLANIVDMHGGAIQNPIWAPDGKIYFRQSFQMNTSAMYAVPDSGGTAVKLYDNQLIRPYTIWLPGGSLLEAGSDGKAAIYSLNEAKHKPLEHKLVTSRFQFIPSEPGALSGHILHGIGSRLFARPFNASSLALSGVDIPLVDAVDLVVNTSDYRFSAAGNGMLAYMAPQARRMVWRDRAGKELSEWTAPGGYDFPRISPDGNRVAYMVRDSETGEIQAYVSDSAGERAMQFDPNPGWERQYWSPDGKRLASSNLKLQVIAVRPVPPAVGELTTWPRDGRAVLMDWSPDGHMLLYNRQAVMPAEIWGLPLANGAKPFLIAKGTDSAFSPDGQFVALRGPQGGYQLKRYPATGEEWSLLPEGQSLGSWRHDGREFFCLRHAGEKDEMVAIPVRLDSAQPQIGEPRVLFDVPITGARVGFHVTADGQRFLMVMPANSSAPPEIRILTDWRAVLKEGAPVEP
ncbi:MAG: protein kinase [Acidobacteriota bacterium]